MRTAGVLLQQCSSRGQQKSFETQQVQVLAVVVLAVVVVVRWLQRWLPSLGVLKMGLSKLPRRGPCDTWLS